MSVTAFPTATYTALIADYRKVADNAGLAWDQVLSGTGAVAPAERWNLSAIAGVPGTELYLSSLGTDAKTLAEINRRRADRGEESMDATALPCGWQDLVRALIVKHLVAEKKTPGHAANNVARPTRCLAICCLPASFISEPCPKHLTCLNGCSHLVRIADAKTIANNRQLLARVGALLAQCPSPAAETPAQKTWRLKLEADLERLRRLIATAPGELVFPDGEDHASSYAHQPVSLL